MCIAIAILGSETVEYPCPILRPLTPGKRFVPKILIEMS